MGDLLIRNANLVDGTGAPARSADLRIGQGRILEIAEAGTLDPKGAEVLDAAGHQSVVA